MKEKFKRLCESLKNQEEINLLRDTKAIAIGMKNFRFLNNKVEQLAMERLENSCKSCKFNIEEPIEELRVTDTRISDLTNRTCGDCGCVLSYKLRQSVKKCSKWEQ